MASVSVYATSGYQNFKLTFEHAELTDQQRRGLKLLFDLDVPSWQQEWTGPKSLTGALDIGGLRVEVEIEKAFVCAPVDGEFKETPRSDTELKQADELEQMTPEQALEHLRLQAAKLREPKRTQVYDCKPVELVRETPQ